MPEDVFKDELIQSLRRSNRELDRACNAMIEKFAHALDMREVEPPGHTHQLADFTVRLAKAMGVEEEQLVHIRRGALLHDIGKIGVRDTILLKPGKLTDEEKTEINLHPVIGANIIEPLRFFPKERELIMHHHENFDGSGYPDGLSGDRIPIAARILAVADAYDAMTSSRPYRAAKSRDFAVEELRRCSNSQFDGEVVRVFLQTLGEGEPSHAH